MSKSTGITTNSLMGALTFVLGLGNLLFAEKIPVNGGFGWDGQLYGRWAKDFYQEVIIKGVGLYHIQRILPSAVVHYGLRLFRIPLEDQNIIIGFGVLNLLLLTIAAYVWGLVAGELRIGEKGKWLGFAAMFVNFATLKMAFYSPVLTDTSAFALGMLMLYFFLKENSLGVLIVSILGAFTWPSMIYFGLALFVFPRRNNDAVPARFNLNIVAAFFAALVILAGIIYFHFIKNLRPSTFESKSMPVESVILLSVASTTLYVFFAAKPLTDYDGLYDITRVVRSLRRKNVLIAIAVLLAIRMIITILGTGEPGPTRLFFVTTLLESVTKPLIFVIAHTVYYGPPLILTYFLWKPICRLIHQHGMGLTVVMIVGVVLSINPESRRLINLLPFFVAFTVKAVESLRWNASRYWLMAGLSLLFSKIWLPINTRPLEGSPLDFPLQRYFMNHGPWMSNQMYLIQGSIVLLTAVVFYSLFFRTPNPPDVPSERSS